MKNNINVRVMTFIDQTDETDMLLLNSHIERARSKGLVTEDAIQRLEKDCNEYIAIKHKKGEELGGKFNLCHIFDQLPDNRFVMLKKLYLKNDKVKIIPFDEEDFNKRVAKKMRNQDSN